MDLDFIAELDKDLSNVGSDKLWKRTIGGVELWISPLTLVGQEKVSETIANSELGAAIVAESKRVTLAYAIVGVSNRDLRPYRHGTAVFPSKNKEGKPIKVALEKYMYEKLAMWGHEFIDNLFEVYADIMETHKRENLKEVKFDNLKSPVEELGDLMLRVMELRQHLGLPHLVESTEEAPEAPEEPKEATPFNPFTADAPDDGDDGPLRVGDIPEGVRPKYTPTAPHVPAGASNVGPPVINVQAPSEELDEKFEAEKAAQIELEEAMVSSAKAPEPIQLRDDVLEARTRPSTPIQPPQIDRVAAPRNPRFAVPSK